MLMSPSSPKRALFIKKINLKHGMTKYPSINKICSKYPGVALLSSVYVPTSSLILSTFQFEFAIGP